MDTDTKLLLGKLLGEVYRIQKNNEDITCSVENAQIYGLLNGFETAIDYELEIMGHITNEQLTAVSKVLMPIFNDKEKLNEFQGFYDIEDELKSLGVDRVEAIKILTYFKAKNQFISIIEKMDSSGSPSECRKFDLYERDK